MTSPLRIEKDSAGRILLNGAILDATRWSAGDAGTSVASATPEEAAQALARDGGLRHIVIGIIGPREASPEQLAVAKRIGAQLGGLGFTLICGGKSGVMESASRGCSVAGGLMIGILPGNRQDDANPFVGIPLPTGLSEGRNMVIAKASRVLIAVGGSYGTLSEVAYGLHFSKPVIGVAGAAQIEGVQHVKTADDAVTAALSALFATAFTTAAADSCKKIDRTAP